MACKFSCPGFSRTYKLITAIVLVSAIALIITQLNPRFPILPQRTKLQENKLSSPSAKATPNQMAEEEPSGPTQFNLTIEKIKNGFFVDNEAFLIKDGVGEKLIEISPENQRVLTGTALGRLAQPTACLYTVKEPVLNPSDASGDPYRDYSQWGGGKQCEDCWGQLGIIWEKEVRPNSTARFLNEGKEIILLFRGNPQSSPDPNTGEILYEVKAVNVKLDGYDTPQEQNVLRESIFLPGGGLVIDLVSPDQRFVFFRICREIGFAYQYLLDLTAGELTKLGRLITPIIGDQNLEPKWNYLDNTLVYFTTIKEPEDAVKEPLIQGKITYDPISKKEISREEITI
jgi:hypothetical protein